MATIKERLSRPEVINALENIYAIDSLYNGRYSHKLSTEARSSLDQRSNELETIATSIISSTLGKAVGGKGNSAASLVINTTTTGLQIASAIDKINDIADEFCDHMEHAILEIANSLPDNRGIIRHIVPSLTDEQSSVLEDSLNRAGIFIDQWEIDEELLGFKQGIDEILLISGYEVQNVISGSSIDNATIEPFEFKELSIDLSTPQESKMQEIERRNLDRMQYAIGLEYKKYKSNRRLRRCTEH